MSMSPAARDQVERYYDGTMLPDELVTVMSSDTGWFPARTVRRGPQTAPLRRAGRALPHLEIVDHGRVFDLYDYLSVNRVAGLLILKDGEVVEEVHALGTTPETIWKSCSLAKSVTATLVGMAIKEGLIESLDDPVSRYARVGGIYSDVSLRQLLRMASGVRWREDYGDPTSDRRQLMAIQSRWEKGGILRHMGTLPAETPPGGSWKYNTGDSYLVSAVMEGATGMNLADYLSRLWPRLGAEADAYWWSEAPDGMTVAGSGFNARLRDYGRFGQFVLNEGRIGDDKLLPDGWTQEAGSAYHIGAERIPYGYMWWIPVLDDPALEGTFQAEGIYGQFIHINPRERLVVVVLSARSKPGYRNRLEINDDAFFAAVAKAYG
jgi:CubicO group peptidase (beta-lactamase class C family)